MYSMPSGSMRKNGPRPNRSLLGAGRKSRMFIPRANGRLYCAPCACELLRSAIPCMTTCALIAAYDEASRIAEVIRGMRPHVEHVIVVDDGSTDGTGAVAAAAGAEVVTHPVIKARAPRFVADWLPFSRAAFSHVLLLDGDMQHAPDDAPGLIAAARRATAISSSENGP